jgi:hypothetical protein
MTTRRTRLLCLLIGHRLGPWRNVDGEAPWYLATHCKRCGKRLETLKLDNTGDTP